LVHTEKLEEELKEWIEEDDREATESGREPLTPERRRKRFENYSQILTANELDAPILVCFCKFNQKSFNVLNHPSRWMILATQMKNLKRAVSNFLAT
jgi:hypothetical protein